MAQTTIWFSQISNHIGTDKSTSQRPLNLWGRFLLSQQSAGEMISIFLPNIQIMTWFWNQIQIKENSSAAHLNRSTMGWSKLFSPLSLCHHSIHYWLSWKFCTLSCLFPLNHWFIYLLLLNLSQPPKLSVANLKDSLCSERKHFSSSQSYMGTPLFEAILFGAGFILEKKHPLTIYPF